MVEQPSGTVTLVFTDIEGSTRLLRELGREAYLTALTDHRRIIRSACVRHAGYEVDYEGDAFFYAFSSASDAIGAIDEAMSELEGGPICVRVGVHTGEPGLDPPKYVGMDVHLAARVTAAGHGGQVLLTGATRALVDRELKALGKHRLKDIDGTVALYQLGEREFPPLRTLSNTNLPRPTSSFVGRGSEVADVLELLGDSGVRLVTLTGAGGTGKTRLALQSASDVLDAFEDGVFFVALAALRAPALVVPAIAQAIGVQEVPRDPLLVTLANFLQQRQMLLVLDNFEQVIEAANDLAALLQRCSKLKLLVTSRQRLRLPGERVYEVPPLRLPARGLAPEQLLENEAIMLFAARAGALIGAFHATNENAPVIGAICAQVDGLPLAIELAAARATVLSPEALLHRLEQRLELLTSGPRDADQRQRTLRDTIEWSYDMLTPEEQQLFVRLAVFVDGCRLEAAEAVCDIGVDEHLTVLNGVQSLVEKSLLRRREDSDGAPRFWMLETIREYGRARLARAPFASALAERHAHYFLQVAEEAEPQLHSPNQVTWLRRLMAERGNLREALAYATRCEDGNLKLRLCAALGDFWLQRAASEGSSWYDEALSFRVGIDPRVRAAALRWAAFFPLWRGDVTAARQLAKEGIDACNAIGDKRGAAIAMQALGSAASNPSSGKRIIEASIPLFEDVGDRWGLSRAQNNLGYLLFVTGGRPASREHLEQSLGIANDRGDRETAAMAQQNLALIDLLEGDDKAAGERLAECVVVGEEIENFLLLAACLALLARVACRAGDTSRAVELLARCDQLQERGGFRLEGLERKLADEARSEIASRLGQRPEVVSRSR